MSEHDTAEVPQALKPGKGALQPAELARLEAWYRIISERDGTAERRVWHWQL